MSDVPANTHDWPQGAFYRYEHIYDSRNVGYAGPRFGYPTMPDQFTLEAFRRHELAPAHRRPVFAEVDLISSHAPWSRTPRMVPDSAIGDGSVYDGMPATLPSEKDIWPSPTKVKAAYGTSIEYSLQALVSFVAHHGTSKTVLVVLGDHQPATIVTGSNAEPRRPGERDRQGPGRPGPDRRLGLAARAAARPTTRRSGGWTGSATGSWPRTHSEQQTEPAAAPTTFHGWEVRWQATRSP